jgi:hypothetical protein
MEKLVYQGSTDEEKKLRAALKEAAEAIVAGVGSRGLDAVVLAGGFGRGEGALQREEGSEGRPFNDFDLLLVGTRSGVPARVLGELRRTLPRLLDVEFADINYIRASELKKVSPSIFFYELKNGNRTLWGSADVLEALPLFEPSELPMTEATRLFLNRGLGLLSVLLHLDEGEESEGLLGRAAVAWSKTILAAGDSFLLEQRLYHWSYVERMRRLREIAKYSTLEAGFADAYVSAATFKLTADFSILPTRNAAELCLEARRFHERYFRALERKRTFADLTDWKTYPPVVLRAGLQPLRRRIKEYLMERGDTLARLRGLWRFARLPLWNEERRLALMPLLLYAVHESDNRVRERSYVAEANEIQFGRRTAEASAWKRLTAELVGEAHP